MFAGSGVCFFIGLICLGGGYYSRWMGSKVIREKRLALSLKQQLLFGKTHMTGDEAVFWGKFAVKFSWVFFVFSGLMGLIAIGLFGMAVVLSFSPGGRAMSGPPSMAQMQADAERARRDAMARANNPRNRNRSNSNSSTSPNPQQLGRPSRSLPGIQLADSGTGRTDYAGFKTGPINDSSVEADKYLVGMIVGLDETWDTPGSLQPVYQRNRQYLKGSTIGGDCDEFVTLLAKPGYAVAGIIGYEGAGLWGVKLLCAKVTPIGQLDLGDTYLTEVAGKEQGTAKQIKPDSYQMPVGVYGYVSSDRMRSIGLQTAPRRDNKQVAIFQLRDWRSVKGKFTVRARFAELRGDLLELHSASQNRIEVNINDLSEDDLRYLSNNNLLE